MKFFFSTIFLLCAATSLWGQAPDSIPEDPYPWRPSFVRLGYDMAPAGQTIFSPNYFGQGLSAEIDFNTLFLVTEAGYMDRKYPASNYSSNGYFFRVGVDANMIKYDQSKNVITFGVRYAGATFQQQLMTEASDDFGQREIAVTQTGVQARWFEAGLGLKVRIWKELFAGYDFTLRFGANIDDEGEILPFFVPGYGQAYTQGSDPRGLVLGFKYSLYWTLRIRDKPVPIRKVKPPKVYDSPLEEQNQNISPSNFGTRN
ncbi:MAG: DUF6048 family protein [Bacteroidota bacterium]